MSLLAKLKCFGFGHDWQRIEDNFLIVRAHHCRRCGLDDGGVQLPYPVQPMPPCQPAKKVIDDLVVRVSVDCDGLDELERRVAALHAQWSAITAMRDAHKCADIAQPTTIEGDAAPS